MENKNTLPIDEKGKIKKSDLIKEQLRNAPKLDENLIFAKLSAFCSTALNRKVHYLFLNSREVNYNMMFDISKAPNGRLIANYIMDYLNESSYVGCDEQEPGLVSVDELKQHPMNDIRDFDDTNSNILGIYIGLEYFQLSFADYLLEVVR